MKDNASLRVVQEVSRSKIGVFPKLSDNDTSCLADYTFTMPFGSFCKTTQGNLGNVFKLVLTLLRSAIFKHLIVCIIGVR